MESFGDVPDIRIADIRRTSRRIGNGSKNKFMRERIYVAPGANGTEITKCLAMQGVFIRKDLCGRSPKNEAVFDL